MSEQPTAYERIGDPALSVNARLSLVAETLQSVFLESIDEHQELNDRIAALERKLAALQEGQVRL